MQLPTDLEAAQAEHQAAEAQWRSVRLCEQDLVRGRARTPDGRPLDEVAKELALAAIAGERTTAAARLAVARNVLASTKVAAANESLATLAPQHAEAVCRVIDAQAGLEVAWSQLVDSAWRTFRARDDERRIAGLMARAAVEASPDPATAQAIRLDREVEVPTSVDDDGRPDGRATRPPRGLLGGSSEIDDPAFDGFWTNLGSIARDENRARRHLPPAALHTIDRVVERQTTTHT